MRVDPVEPVNSKILKFTSFIAETTKNHNMQMIVAQKRLRI
jgi:hypothetical protein